MARFYGVVSGRARSPASRLGTGALRTVAASWQGAVKVSLYIGADGSDYALVQLSKWHGAGTDRLLYEGPVAGSGRSRLVQRMKPKRSFGLKPGPESQTSVSS